MSDSIKIVGSMAEQQDPLTQRHIDDATRVRVADETMKPAAENVEAVYDQKTGNAH